MTDDLHPYEQYFRKHGHYPRARLDIGGGKTVECVITPHYAALSTYPYSHAIYIPRSQLVKLIKWMIPLVKRMSHQDFSVEQAMSDYLVQEAEHQRELRELKRQLYGNSRAQRSSRRRRKQQT